MSDKSTDAGSDHVHVAECIHAEAWATFRCLECEILFEGGIADFSKGGSERCPQCGLQNAILAESPAPEEFVVRHTSRFR